MGSARRCAGTWSGVAVCSPADPLRDGRRARPDQGFAGTVHQEAGDINAARFIRPGTCSGIFRGSIGKRPISGSRLRSSRRAMPKTRQLLRTKNESARIHSWKAFEELLTLHRLNVPARLRKTLMSTNPIESLLSLVRHSEHHIKLPCGSTMLQQ